MTDQEINEAVGIKLGHSLDEIRTGEGYDYSTSIEAAWEIVNHVGKLNSWTLQLLMNPNLGETFWRAQIAGDTFADADTAPKAICLAFLKLP